MHVLKTNNKLKRKHPMWVKNMQRKNTKGRSEGRYSRNIVFFIPTLSIMDSFGIYLRGVGFVALFVCVSVTLLIEKYVCM